ncbi:unnamed protein product [Rhizophagus irregularis]|nr:unnamed protein product [Rhizophagus irregularis]
MFQTSLKKYKRKFCFLYLSLILQRAVQEVSGQRAELPIDLPIIFFITHILQLLTSLCLYIFKRLKLNVKTVDQNYIGTKLYDEKEKERSRFRCIETPSCESETDHLKKCAMDNNAINELLIISSNLSGKDRKENVNVSRNSGKMDEGGFSIKTGVFNREVSSHSLKRKHESKEVGPGKDGQKAEVTFEDESKEVEPEKDGQKAEVTFEDELEGLEKDDQKEESKGSEKKDNPFIAMDWHAWLERILEFSIEEARINILTYKYTPANGFEEIMIKYIGKVLMDFINKIIDVPSHVMTIDEVERDWIVDKISPMFTYMQATFINKIKFQCQHTNGLYSKETLQINIG